ncbi:uncharacterized protein LOC143219693 [Lasioglossum baleicum]|uniref:uncharacterized protein LOC143219693 n=1 Tax=Lasioglossum baleicum TaxID=434251 RepID=UPI003FCD798F
MMYYNNHPLTECDHSSIEESHKKRRLNNMSFDNSDSISQSSSSLHRILSRRYSIAGNYFKYLEIGVHVGDDICVELTMGDNRGNEITFSRDAWTELLRTKECISNLLSMQKQCKKMSDDLTLQIVNLNGMNLVKLSNQFTALYITEKTMRNLYNLEFCIHNMYSWLIGNVPTITDKFMNFVIVVRDTNAKNIVKAIVESEFFDQSFKLADTHTIIDLEFGRTSNLHVAVHGGQKVSSIFTAHVDRSHADCTMFSIIVALSQRGKRIDPAIFSTQ